MTNQNRFPSFRHPSRAPWRAGLGAAGLVGVLAVLSVVVPGAAHPALAGASVPGAPTALEAHVSGSTVTLSWHNPGAVTGDDVYRNGELLVVLTAPVVTTYANLDVPPGTHRYVVAAFNAAGLGPDSASVIVSTTAEPHGSGTQTPGPAPGAPPPSSTSTTGPAVAPAPKPTSTPSDTSTTTTMTTTSPPAAVASLSFPIRAAFFYPWYPEAWNQQGMDPFTKYHPSLGYYSETSAVVAEQIQAMQYGDIQAGIASWWGQGSPTDQRFSMLLQQAQALGFKWTLYYEAGGNAISTVPGSPHPSVAQIESDLNYIWTNYAQQPAFLHVDGKPVIFVYGDSTESCADVANWAQANASHRFYVNLKVFSGYRSCPDQPDGWHQYGPAVATDSQAGYSFSVSPGFNKANEAAPRLARDPTVFQSDVQQMVASGAPWQLVTTFNEWGEGTAVESAQEWASPSGEGTYLDILHSIP